MRWLTNRDVVFNRAAATDATPLAIATPIGPIRRWEILVGVVLCIASTTFKYGSGITPVSQFVRRVRCEVNQSSCKPAVGHVSNNVRLR